MLYSKAKKKRELIVMSDSLADKIAQTEKVEQHIYKPVKDQELELFELIDDTPLELTETEETKSELSSILVIGVFILICIVVAFGFSLGLRYL